VVPLDPSRPGDADFAAALSHYDTATRAQLAGYAAEKAGNAAEAQTQFGIASTEFGTARGLFDAFAPRWCGATPTAGQVSIRCDNAAYLGGRCSYEIGTLSKLAADFQDAVARLDAMEATYPTSALKDSASYFDGRAHFHLKEWELARAQLQLSLSLNPAGTFADNAQYYIGRTWYEQGYALVNVATLPSPGTPDYVTASTAFANAEAELTKVLTAFPASPYVVNARYYLGRTWLFRPYDSSVSNAARVSNLNTAIGWFDQVIAGNGLFVASARFFRGRAHYDLAFELAAGTVLDAGQLAAALVDLKQVPPPDVYADNALYYVAKVYVHELVCSGGTDPAPASACAAYAELKTLQATDPLYATTPYLAKTQTYIQTNLPSCACSW
jgi:TolA-binding protein